MRVSDFVFKSSGTSQSSLEQRSKQTSSNSHCWRNIRSSIHWNWNQAFLVLKTLDKKGDPMGNALFTWVFMSCDTVLPLWCAQLFQESLRKTRQKAPRMIVPRASWFSLSTKWRPSCLLCTDYSAHGAVFMV